MDVKLPSPVIPLENELFTSKGLTVNVKRDDLIHPVISGNKWRKLKLNIEKYKAKKYEGIVTFGGAYSNHISAVAAVGRALNIPTIGIIRGAELNKTTNATLQQAHADGMQLQFVTREEYSWRYEMDYKHQLRTKFGNVLVIEEGGANFHGVMGCAELVGEVDKEPDYYCLAAGTGTTTAGILFASSKKVLVVPVFKKGDFIRDEIKDLLYYTGLTDEELEETMSRLTLATDYHFGGYGKSNQQLIDFMNEFYKTSSIPTDHIYTAKLFYALMDLVEKNEFEEGSNLLAIHTGGLQGNASIKNKLIF